METGPDAMKSLIDWSMLVLMLVICMYTWSKSQKYGWRRLSDLSVIILFAFATAIGEQWYLGHKSIPWCYGVSDFLIDRTGHASIAFLVLISLGGMYLIRWLILGYNKVKRLPGTLQPMFVSAIIIIMFLHFTVTASAYYHKISGNQPGGTVVTFARQGTISILNFAIGWLQDDNFKPYIAGDGS